MQCLIGALQLRFHFTFLFFLHEFSLFESFCTNAACSIIFSAKNLYLTSELTVYSEKTFKPISRWFRNPGKVILVIYIVESKPNCVPRVPLPVVEQRPCKVTTNVAAIFPVLKRHQWNCFLGKVLSLLRSKYPWCLFLGYAGCAENILLFCCSLLIAYLTAADRFER